MVQHGLFKTRLTVLWDVVSCSKHHFNVEDESCGIYHCVVSLNYTDVSDVRTAFIRVMDAVRMSETSV
jgi:hypothetical protein